MGPLGKLSISRVEKPRLGCGIYISPYVAHSWVQTGTGANMQRRQYLHSSELCLGSQEGLGLFQSQQTKRGGAGGMPGGVRLAGKSQAGQRPLEWQERRSLHQTIDCRGGGNILHQTGNLEPKGAWSKKYLQEPLSTGLILLMEKLRPREKIEFSERHIVSCGFCLGFVFVWLFCFYMQLRVCECMLGHSVVFDSLWIPWTVAGQAPLSIGFSRQEYWRGLPILSLGDLPDPGIEPGSPGFPALAGVFFTSAPLQWCLIFVHISKESPGDPSKVSLVQANILLSTALRGEKNKS